MLFDQVHVTSKVVVAFLFVCFFEREKDFRILFIVKMLLCKVTLKEYFSRFHSLIIILLRFLLLYSAKIVLYLFIQ